MSSAPPTHTCSVSTTDQADSVPVKFAPTGIASKEGTPPVTVTKLLQQARDKFGDAVALRVERPLAELKQGETPPAALPTEEWTSWTYNQYYDEVASAAKSLIKIGVAPLDAVSIFGFNAPEWIMGELAAIVAGGVATGIYPTDTPEQVAFKLNHSGSVVTLVGDITKYDKIASKVDELPLLKAIVAWDAPEVSGKKLTRKDGSTVAVYTWQEFCAFGKDVADADLDARIAAQDPGSCCTIIYTSGTTGDPKGVMISHDNIVFESNTVFKMIDTLGSDPSQPERILSYVAIVLEASSARGMMERSFLLAGYGSTRREHIRPNISGGLPTSTDC
jgi:long-chain-fatty-acid--CoA ligase ACSBG